MGAAETLDEMGYGDAIVFEDPAYDSALIGVTSDGRAVYDYNKMVEYLVGLDGITEEEAEEFINYNTIRALDYMGEGAPVVIFPLWNTEEEAE